MLGEPDQYHLALAEESDCLLVTFDDDFLSLVESEELEHAGIIFVHQAGRDIDDVVKAVDSHLSERPSDDRGIFLRVIH